MDPCVCFAHQVETNTIIHLDQCLIPTHGEYAGVVPDIAGAIPEEFAEIKNLEVPDL
jgi:hypothetical protein